MRQEKPEIVIRAMRGGQGRLAHLFQLTTTAAATGRGVGSATIEEEGTIRSSDRDMHYTGDRRPATNTIRRVFGRVNTRPRSSTHIRLREEPPTSHPEGLALHEVQTRPPHPVITVHRTPTQEREPHQIDARNRLKWSRTVTFIRQC